MSKQDFNIERVLEDVPIMFHLVFQLFIIRRAFLFYIT